MVEFQGFVALFKLNPKFSYRSDDINVNYIKEKQHTIQSLTNIQVEWLDESFKKGKPNFDEEFASNKTLILHID